MTRSLEQVISELNRAKAQLDQLQKSEIFDASDRAILEPKYQKTIKDLDDEYHKAKINEIEVHDPIRLGSYPGNQKERPLQ
ncbi:hypothetical protein ACE939_00725 [Aquimarina sp. W85]|uniref:hypothetical protein n=1 Tax=Aquimarina rhodophyticola TaxID=3342246 RepID=UPI00366E0358